MRYGDAELTNIECRLREDAEDLFDDAAVRWLAQAELTQYLPSGAAEEGQWLSRLPEALRRKVNPLAQLMALAAPGCELRFRIHSGTARLKLRAGTRPRPNGVHPATIEVYQGVFQTAWHVVERKAKTIEIALPENLALLQAVSEREALPYDAGLTRIVLPWEGPAQLIGLEGDIEPPRVGDVPARRMLSYGSSITHGALAIRPTGSWAWRLSDKLGVDRLNLGFGGGAHLEPEMADYIAERQDWALATLELGINIVGTVTVDEFAERVAYFVPRIAQAHPDKWIFCVDLFRCAHDPANVAKIDAYRAVVRRQVEALALPRLVHVPGEAVLTSMSGLAADLVHPSPAGMEEIATNMARVIREKMG